MTEKTQKLIRMAFALVGIMLFIGAFFWVGDVYTYLDQHFWHLDDIAKQKTIPLTYFFLFWPLSWIVSFIASAIPFFAIGFISMHFQYEEIKQKEQAELELEKAKKASNLYINTNRSRN